MVKSAWREVAAELEAMAGRWRRRSPAVGVFLVVAQQAAEHQAAAAEAVRRVALCSACHRVAAEVVLDGARLCGTCAEIGRRT